MNGKDLFLGLQYIGEHQDIMDDKAAYLFRVGGFDYVSYFHACLRKKGTVTAIEC